MVQLQHRISPCLPPYDLRGGCSLCTHAQAWLAPGTLHIVPRNLLTSVTLTASGQRQTPGHSLCAVSVAVNLAAICRYTGWQARAAIGVLTAESGVTAILVVCSCSRALISPAVPLHDSSFSLNAHHNTHKHKPPPNQRSFSTCLAAELLVALAPIAAALRVPATAANVSFAGAHDCAGLRC